MMNFDEFCTEISDRVSESLDGNERISIVHVNKNNGVELTGIAIQTDGSNIAPTMYLNDAYHRYENGISISEISQAIVASYREHCSPELSYQNYTDIDYVKNNIIFCLVNTDRNGKMLKDIPHRDYMDLSLVLRVLIKNEDGGWASILVNNSHVDMWDVKESQLFRWAKKNTEKILPASIMSITSILPNMSDSICEDIDDEIMLIITNKDRIHGAGVILYHTDNKLKEIVNKWNSDIYILPSSVHEVLAVRTSMGTPEELLQMVSDINKDVLSDEEILSDSVYMYTKDGDFTKVA